MRSFSSAEGGADALVDTDAEAQAKATLYLRMRARGIQDLRLLRAFEQVSRAFFLDERCRDLAARDLPLPIPCGQTQMAPGVIAAMIEALGVEPGHRLLEIGSGTGYATAILATLADEVIGVERFRSLAQAAQERLTHLHVVNAAVIPGDGLALPPRADNFDRLIAHGQVADPAVLFARLAPGGVLVCGRAGPDGAGAIVRIEKTEDGFSETTILAYPLPPIIPGVAEVL
jgi:protein-L-isoaspartate(D-aspartate) O-methyltransferase